MTKKHLPIGTLVETKAMHDRHEVILKGGKLWIVRGTTGGERQLYQLSSLATGEIMTTHPDNFVTCVDEEEAA